MQASTLETPHPRRKNLPSTPKPVFLSRLAELPSRRRHEPAKRPRRINALSSMLCGRRRNRGGNCAGRGCRGRVHGADRGKEERTYSSMNKYESTRQMLRSLVGDGKKIAVHFTVPSLLLPSPKDLSVIYIIRHRTQYIQVANPTVAVAAAKSPPETTSAAVAQTAPEQTPATASSPSPRSPLLRRSSIPARSPASSPACC